MAFKPDWFSSWQGQYFLSILHSAGRTAEARWKISGVDSGTARLCSRRVTLVACGGWTGAQDLCNSSSVLTEMWLTTFQGEASCIFQTNRHQPGVRCMTPCQGLDSTARMNTACCPGASGAAALWVSNTSLEVMAGLPLQTHSGHLNT